MASTFSPSLKIELIGNGDQSGTWGTTTNNNLGTLLEQAITGVQTITMVNADKTLTSYNGVSDEARNAVIVVDGTNSAVRNIIAPSVNKTYIIANNTTGGFGINIKTASSAGVLIPNGAKQIVYCDGSEFYTLTEDRNFDGNVTVNGNLSVTGSTSLITTATKSLTADTATSIANAFLGCISGNVLIVTSVIDGSLAIGQFLSGKDVLDGTKISATGTGTGSAAIVGSISGTTLTVSSVTSGSLNIGQYILGNGVTLGTRITSGSGTSWGLSASQTVAAGTVINAYGAGSTGTGNYVVDVPSTVFVGSISGTTLTVDSVTSGTIIATQLLYGVGIIGGTTISGGGGTTWVVNTSQTTPPSSTFYAYSPLGSGVTQTATLTPIIGVQNLFGIANNDLFSSVAKIIGTLSIQDSNAVSITGGSITGITDLAVADGGTGVSTITRNSVVVGNGTSAVTSITPATNGNVLTATAGATVSATSLVEGTRYTILTIGATPTNWVAIGASSATVGVSFVKDSTVATGNGTATTNVWTSAASPVPDELSTATGSAPSYSARAYANINAGTVVNITGSYSRTSPSTTVSITTSTAHPFRVGDTVYLNFTSGTAADDAYIVVTAADSTHFTVSTAATTTTAGTITIPTVAIRKDGNVSSVSAETTTTSASLYYINFTTSMPDANYAAIVTVSAGTVAVTARTARTLTVDTGSTNVSFIGLAIFD